MNEKKARPELVIKLGGKKRTLNFGFWAMRLLQEEGLNAHQIEKAIDGGADPSVLPLVVWASVAAVERELEGATKQARRDNQHMVSLWVEDLCWEDGVESINEILQGLTKNSVFATEASDAKKKSPKKSLKNKTS